MLVPFYFEQERIFGAVKSSSEVHALRISDKDVPVLIHYESRRSARVSIGKKGIIIRIPRYISNVEKSSYIENFKLWAQKKLLQRPELLAEEKKDYYSGKIIAIREKSFVLELKFTDANSSRARLKENIITLHLSTRCSEEQIEKAIPQLISKCVAKEFHLWLQQRLHELNTQHFPQRMFKTLSLKYTNSRWGSCSSSGNISISTRLLLAPDYVVDYVLIHELAHLLVQNHSRKFWNTVASAMPDFERSERWLKEYGRGCDF